jgi:hypothetical protein
MGSVDERIEDIIGDFKQHRRRWWVVLHGLLLAWHDERDRH